MLSSFFHPFLHLVQSSRASEPNTNNKNIEMHKNMKLYVLKAIEAVRETYSNLINSRKLHFFYLFQYLSNINGY